MQKSVCAHSFANVELINFLKIVCKGFLDMRGGKVQKQFWIWMTKPRIGSLRLAINAEGGTFLHEQIGLIGAYSFALNLMSLMVTWY